MSAFERQLATALNPLPITLPATFVPRAARYLSELQRWNRVINMSARGDEEALVAHFIDSLSLHPLLCSIMRDKRGDGAGDGVDNSSPATNDAAIAAPFPQIADIGAGNGFPTLPLALTMTHAHFTMIEANQKRAAFLHHIVALLELRHCTVIRARVEKVTARYRLVCARAFSPWQSDIVAHIAAMLLPYGALIVYAVANSEKSQRVAAHLSAHFSHIEYIPVLWGKEAGRLFIVASGEVVGYRA